MKQQNNSLQLMSVLVVLITIALFFLFVHLATDFYKRVGDNSRLVSIRVN